MTEYMFIRFYFSTRLNETEDGIHNAIAGYGRPGWSNGVLCLQIEDGYTLSRASGMYRGKVENTYLLTIALPYQYGAEAEEEIPAFVDYLKKRFQQEAILVSTSYSEIGTFQ